MGCAASTPSHAQPEQKAPANASTPAPKAATRAPVSLPPAQPVAAAPAAAPVSSGATAPALLEAPIFEKVEREPEPPAPAASNDAATEKDDRAAQEAAALRIQCAQRQKMARQTVQTKREGQQAKDSPKDADTEIVGNQTYAMIKPGNEANWGNAVAAIIYAGFTIEAMRVLTMDADLVNTFYAEHIGKGFFETLSAYMTSGPVLALRLRRADAVRTWRQLIGPTNLEKAKAEAPSSLRALYGRSGTENFAHGSDADATAARELGIIFGAPAPPTPAEASAPDAERTYAMIKPGFTNRWGDVLTRVVAEGFTIVQIRRTAFEQKDIDVFYAEHIGKGFFETLGAYMTSGDIVGLCLERPNAISHWRAVLGPTNLEKAKAEAPSSLRALFAKSTTENLCHGSDAVASAAREIGLVFGPEPIGC